MSDGAIIVKTEGAADEAASDVQRDLGHAEAEIEHHEEQLEEHGDKIENIEGDAEWTKQRISSLEAMIANLPQTSAEEIANLRSEIDRLSSTVSSLVSAGEPTPQEIGETTEPPPKVENAAKETEVTGPFAGLRKLLHRLL